MTAVKESNESGFSWELIAKQVKTRNAAQCLRKWYKGVWLNKILIFDALRHHHMCWKSSGSTLIRWSREDEVRLVQELVMFYNDGRGSTSIVVAGLNNQQLLTRMKLIGKKWLTLIGQR